MAAGKAHAKDFDAVLIPGGHAPDRMRMRHAMIDLVRDMLAAGKPVAAIQQGRPVADLGQGRGGPDDHLLAVDRHRHQECRRTLCGPTGRRGRLRHHGPQGRRRAPLRGSDPESARPPPAGLLETPVPAPVTEIPRHDIIRHLGHRRTVVGEAPGRVNLIGEHTDYTAASSPDGDPAETRSSWRQADDACGPTAPTCRTSQPITSRRSGARRHDGWMDYVQGLTQAVLAPPATRRWFRPVHPSRCPSAAGCRRARARDGDAAGAARPVRVASIDDS